MNFAPIDPGAGTIDRRRICTPCIDQVDALLAGGETNVSAIYRATRVSHCIVRQRRDALGLQKRPYKRLDDIDALVELTLANTSVENIASQLGVEAYTVRRHQTTLGLRDRARQRRPLSDEVLERAERMLREERTSYLETARTLEVDATTLLRRFPGLGWTNEDHATMATVLHTPELKRLHEEVFGRQSGN